MFFITITIVSGKMLLILGVIAVILGSISSIYAIGGNHLKIMLLTYLKICGITNILETDELVGCISSL